MIDNIDIFIQGVSSFPKNYTFLSRVKRKIGRNKRLLGFSSESQLFRKNLFFTFNEIFFLNYTMNYFQNYEFGFWNILKGNACLISGPKY